MLKAGSQAPEITALEVDGNPRSLNGLLASGTSVLLAFFKVSCPTCQFTFPYLQRFADHGITVVGVSQDGAPATDAFRDRYDLRFPIWLDAAANGYAASNSYAITHVPSLFLVTADGTIERAVSGFSRQDLDEIGEQFGFAPFGADEAIPAFRPG
jgi:peroxiredoxin